MKVNCPQDELREVVSIDCVSAIHSHCAAVDDAEVNIQEAVDLYLESLAFGG
jgi:predicted RNase H-like HicB family nuclease